MAVDIARPPAAPTTENDAGYQAVVRKLGTSASRLKTPVKKPAEKVTEVTAAAELPPTRQKEKNAYNQQMTDLAEAPIPKIEDFTVDKFMDDFRQGFEELAKKLPKESEDNHAVSNAVNFGDEKQIAVKKMESARDTGTADLQKAASRDPADLMAQAPTPATPPELVGDPAGPVPKIPNAAAAAPKPVPSKDISLDDQSKALDDALTNQVAGGQVLNISEDSLSFQVSGEKSFDEAAESKRKAQEAIRKLIPSYRVVEAGVLKKAGSTATHVVDTGVQEYHGSRQHSFKDVLTVQKQHAESVETQKDAVLGRFEGIYNEKKGLVDKELASLNDVGEEFEGILTAVENKLKGWVRQDLEYIYTPGFFDYSDWIDKRKPDVQKEYDRLAAQRKLNVGYDYTLWLKALKTIQDLDAKRLFEDAKKWFRDDVTAGARKIAERVVATLNRANGHIREGQVKTQEIYDGLSAKEKAEYANAFTAVMGQYTTLAETVADKHREIVGDLARSYNKVAGTLQATFEAIRKDVLTSWWEKAWNKIKAVVNAIVEFATRIAQLLGEMLSLVSDIISSPRYFFNNLVTGIGRGLSEFVDRIDEFLADAFFDWLRGSTGVSVQLPKDWDAKGIFSLFMQLLGLSVETIWQRMEVVYDKTIADAFRRGEVLLEKGLELFAIVKAEGLGGLWTHIKESLGTILTDTLESMKETILYAAIKKVMIEVGKLLIPGGGFIAIAEKIIRLVVFIVEARDKILALIQSFVESMALAVRGDVSGIMSKVIGALKSFIVLALDFLVNLFGLGGLKSKVERVIDRVRSPIIRGIDWVLGKLKPIVMRVKGTVVRAKERALDKTRDRLVEEPKDQLSANGRVGSEKAEASGVKAEALQEIRHQLGAARQPSADALRATLAGVQRKLRPHGLHSIHGQLTAQGEIVIAASASLPDTITLHWNQVFSAAQPNMDLYTAVLRSMSGEGQSFETYAAVSVNGRLVAARTNAQRHAESELLNSADWPAAVEAAEKEGRKSGTRAELVVTINRSPCKAICTTVLSNWLSANRSTYSHVHFVLAATGRYSPESTRTKAEMIEEIASYLESRGHTLANGVRLQDLVGVFTRAEIQPVFEEIFGRLVRTHGAREDEMTTEADLVRLARAGWDLRQLQARAHPTPAEGALASMITRVRNDLGIRFDRTETTR